jgi:hypothetical protein
VMLIHAKIGEQLICSKPETRPDKIYFPPNISP